MSESSKEVKSLDNKIKEVNDLIKSLVERIDKLEGNKENTRPINKPDIANANYNNRRSAYISKLHNNDIKQPKEETMKYYNVVYDADKNLYF